MSRCAFLVDHLRVCRLCCCGVDGVRATSSVSFGVAAVSFSDDFSESGFCVIRIYLFIYLFMPNLFFSVMLLFLLSCTYICDIGPFLAILVSIF